MNRLIFILILVPFLHLKGYGQEKLVRDLDNDKVNDTVYVDVERSTIVCKLSGQQFKKMESMPIETLNPQAGVAATKNGFSFFNDWMRAGYKNQFRYDPKAKKMQLIGMSRYEFGNAANDGSGESSVNLLTNDYVGKWNYYDERKEELVSIPAIKTKMILKKTWLDSFNENTYFDYADKCADLYDKQKQILMRKRK